jgi:hypothetical protein
VILISRVTDMERHSKFRFVVIARDAGRCDDSDWHDGGDVLFQLALHFDALAVAPLLFSRFTLTHRIKQATRQVRQKEAK